MQKDGFTLIELSIVLVIIGLIVGGVLVGRDLISAAEIRAQISQIEKYQAAVNTFRTKYGYMPGDIPDPTANSFGFQPRGPFAGQGDGNGLIEGNAVNVIYNNSGIVLPKGETALFWTDLSAANLIDAGVNSGRATTVIVADPITGAVLDLLFPKAKIGNASYVYAWSGGWSGIATGHSDHINYFGISGIDNLNSVMGWLPSTYPTLSVQQAYSIDTKIDDGMPQYGHVLALYANVGLFWPKGGAINHPYGAQFLGDSDPTTNGPVTAASAVSTAPSATTCYDNGSTSGALEHYSTSQNGGTGLNCALSVSFQ